ncbi:MAG: I78 family peptidase inhibitor [Pseudomonadota bacterium]
MRKASLLAPALLSACSTAPAAPIIHGETPGHICQSAGTEQFIGQSPSSAVGAAIMRVTHAAVLRWGAPGTMLTMDFRSDRVTVWYGPDNKITKINCG